MFIPNSIFKYLHDNLLNFISNEQLKYTVVDQNRIPYAIKYNHEIPYVCALADEFGYVKIFKTNLNFKILKEDQLQKNCIYDLIWLTSTQVACCGGDQICFVMDCNNFNKIATLRGHSESVKSITRLNPFVIASGSRDGSILLYDLRCNRKEDNSLTPINSIHSAHSLITKLPGKNGACKNVYKAGPVSTVLFHDEHYLVSSGATDSQIKLWDLRKTYIINKKSPESVHLVAFSPTRNQNKGYSNLVFDHSCAHLYANCMNNSIYKFDFNDFYRLQSIEGPHHAQTHFKEVCVLNKHKNSSNFIKSCVSPDDNFLFTGSSDMNGYIYPLTNKNKYPHVVLQAHLNEVTAVDWCPHDFNQLVSCSDDNTIRLWNVNNNLTNEDEAKCDLKRAKAGELEENSCENDYLLDLSFKNFIKNKCPYLSSIIYPHDLIFQIKKKNSKLLEQSLLSTPTAQSTKWKTPTENLPINLIEIKITPKQVLKAKVLNKREDNIVVQTSVSKKRTIDLLFSDLLLNGETQSSKKRLVMEENTQPTQSTTNSHTPKTPKKRITNRIKQQQQLANPQTPSSSASKSILDYFLPKNILK